MIILLQQYDHCPNVSASNRLQGKALIECFRHGEKMRERIKELVHEGADVGYHDVYGVSAVHEALTYRWDMDMMKLLIVEGRGVDFDKSFRSSPLMKIKSRMELIHNKKIENNPPLWADLDEETAILFVRMGATRLETNDMLWFELNLPRPPGVLLETLMDSLDRLLSLSELEFRALRPITFGVLRDDGDITPWQLRQEGRAPRARGTEGGPNAFVAQKKKDYQQRSREVPSMAHLSRAAIRSYLQADVRKVISWPVPERVRKFILLGYDL